MVPRCYYARIDFISSRALDHWKSSVKPTTIVPSCCGLHRQNYMSFKEKRTGASPKWFWWNREHLDLALKLKEVRSLQSSPLGQVSWCTSEKKTNLISSRWKKPYFQWCTLETAKWKLISFYGEKTLLQICIRYRDCSMSYQCWFI